MRDVLEVAQTIAIIVNAGVALYLVLLIRQTVAELREALSELEAATRPLDGYGAPERLSAPRRSARSERA